MAEQDHRQTAQGKVLRHVVARLARHDDIRTGGDGELSKVAQGAAQNGDGAGTDARHRPTRVDRFRRPWQHGWQDRSASTGR